MSVIHLLGCEGFIGRAVRMEANDLNLHCWSHQFEGCHHFNLLNSSSWHSLLSQRPTHVILLSWPGLPHYREPFHVKRNLPACIELVEQLILGGLRRLVIAGTCYEYGLQNGALAEDQMTNPISSYAIAKDSLRRTIASLCEGKDVTWCWLRIFYPYGAGQNPMSLLPSLEKAISDGEKCFAMSSGRQLRDFVPVQQVARQLLVLATHPYAQGVYNGGSGLARSLREIAESRIEELGADIKLNFGVYPDRLDEPLAFWADMRRLDCLQKT